VADNLADLAAQVAANRQGARDLDRLVERYGWPVVSAYMGHIQQAAEQKMRASLARLTPGRHEFVDHLDDGSPIRVCITVTGDEATIDFTGTGPVLPGNLNANRAIVTAAVMYCLRALLAEDIPLNQGVLAPVKIIVPECLLAPPEGASPETSPAVVGGNVETSQRVVDVVLGALGLAAASQGTMNNLLFGDATFGYYETICGGAGATQAAPGADAVHTHMTNTRLTDPEVLEQRYPVRVRSFSIRRGSGGAGQNRGGDGVVRQLEFLRPLDVSIVSQRRGPYAPYGFAGGLPGSLGRNLLRRAGSSVEEQLDNCVQFRAEPGDVLTIETPGGGGWGEGSDK
jgi:5-oxoprolinase (ATP-hydrolysing)